MPAHQSLFVLPWTPPPPSGEVVLLSRFEGVDLSTNFVNDAGIGAVNFTGTVYHSTDDAKFGSSCLRASAVSNTSVRFGPAAEFLLPTTIDWTVEGFVRFLSGAATYYVFSIIRNDATNLSLFREPFAGPARGVMRTFNNSTLVPIDITLMPLDQWIHFALVRQASVGEVKCYLGGALAATSVDAAPDGSPLTTATVHVGGAGTGPGLSGRIDSFRITTGLARYTAPFTPPTSELTL